MVDWNEIVSREGPAVWRTVYRLVGNRADAEDCFQETFVAALSVWRRESVQHPAALLRRLATSRALDRLRRRYRRARREGGDGPLSEIASSVPHPAESAEFVELSDQLRRALAMLPAKQSQAFCLFHLDDCDYQQISAHMNISVNGVGVLLHRARQRLRKLLADHCDAEHLKTGRKP
jgi:RNA polymerase sigma-70 factor (ECF subfamily)